MLLRLGQAPEKRYHFGLAMPPFQQLASLADVPLGRHEHQDVAAGLAIGEDAIHRLHRPVHIVQGLGPGLGLIPFGGVRAELIKRRVNHLDRKRASRDLHDGRVVERLGKHLGIDGRRRYYNAQLRPLETQVAQMPKQEIDIERALMRLVQNDGIVSAQQRIGLDLGEQHAVGHKFDHRIASGAIVEADLATHLPPPGHVEFFRHPPRNRQRRHPSGLRARDLPASASPGGQTHLWNLGGLTRTRLTSQNQNLMSPK